MFNLEIEKKIVNFVKKSPIGVTSRDIASYIGLNRMTITKYLAIIQERALIDFKQFGMAKLWYIPVNLNKESFFSKIMAKMIINIPKDEFNKLSEKVGMGLGEEINKMYINFNSVKKLNLEQISDSYKDIGKKLGGSFKSKSTNEKISVEILENPFEADNVSGMNTILGVVFAKIAALNLGYGRAVISEPNNQNVIIDVYLKKSLR